MQIKMTCITRFILVALATSGLICSTILSQPVIGLDNWFNDETKKETRKPFHYLWTDTEFSGYSQLGESYIAEGTNLITIGKPVAETLTGTDIYIIVYPWISN